MVSRKERMKELEINERVTTTIETRFDRRRRGN